MKERRDSFRKLVSNRAGFTLFETLFAIFILLIAIVPMINAFGPSLFATASEETNIVFTNYARQTLNRVAVLDFKTLNANQANPVNLDSLFGTGGTSQETFSFKGVNYVPTVGITDKSEGAGGLLEITVTMNQVSLKTLKADY